MRKVDHQFISVRSAVRLALIGSALALPAQVSLADESATPSASSSQELEEVVVTGFRGIHAEDIGKFPDSNLAESMQRIPGVTLSRGDGGEGRNISVRGLGPGFTRVRVKGMEAAAQTGSSDI